MSSALLLGHTDSYLNTEWRGSRSPWTRAKAPGPFVTISREAGSGGASLARLLARKLNADPSAADLWQVVEGNVTTHMLRAHHLPDRLARFLPEDRVPEVTSSIGELLGLHPNLWDLVQKMNATMQEEATSGRVILVGRGANFATAGIPNGLHVRLIAPLEARAQYVAQLYSISVAEAHRCIARCDAARRRYVKTTFNADVADPKGYDLVINTAQVPIARAAELIAAHVGAPVVA